MLEDPYGEVVVSVVVVVVSPEGAADVSGAVRSRVTVVLVSRSITRVDGVAGTGTGRSMTTGGAEFGTGTTSVLSTRSDGGVITVVWFVGSARVFWVEK
jgi:hypothetical protein